jgi:anthranilate/para-aminobenzoate synthase component I
MSVAIRTLQIADGAAALYAGGGVVAESDPAAEYDETLAKAAGILRALGHTEGAAGAVRGGMGVRE